MSGICGAISQYERAVVKEHQIKAMLPALKKRGPDGEGVLFKNIFGFGHARLKILDLSEQAGQPMEDSSLGLSITFDGRIYNYQDLKTELEGKGYVFQTRSNAEVLLKAYHNWGESFVKLLNGMFAFCLYDSKKGIFLMARDRLGIKPFYYTEKNGTLFFASNIRALVDAGVVDKSISREALHYYLSFHGVVPAPYTLFEKVKKLEPGTYTTMDSRGIKKKQRYWQVSFAEEKNLEENEWVEKILANFKNCVKQRLASDVPVGALLSGGVDSSLIVAFMAELYPGKLKTFSVGFDNTGGEEGNEFYYSDLVANNFGAEHKKFFVDAGNLLSSVKSCMQEMSEPMVSHDAVAFYLLGHYVREEAKVVLCGQGADELFAGYHWYPEIMQGTGDPVALYKNAFFDRSHEEILAGLHQDYQPEKDHASQFVESHFSLPGASSAVNKALRIDSTIMSIDDPIKRVDNMTMCWGVEARFPFLDYRMIEVAASIPAAMKVKGGGKYILKKAAEKKIPHEVIYRKKGYFPVPAIKYLQGEFLDFAREILSTRSSQQQSLFRKEYIEELFSNPEKQITGLGVNKLWQVAVLEYWLQQMGV